jgi:hypothetical protein
LRDIERRLAKNGLRSLRIDRTYPSLIKRGLREPTLSIVIRLGRALNINPLVLVKMTLMRVEGAGRLTGEGQRDQT